MLGKVLLMLSFCAVAFAEEDSDLNLIPATLSHQPSSGKDETLSGAWNFKWSADETFTHWGLRNNLTVPSPSTLPENQSLSAMDLVIHFHPNERFSLHWSERINLALENDFSFPSQKTVKDNWREGYGSYELASHFFLEAGRINVRNGVALGYNPTDFLKERSQVNQISIDPSALRQNRLGTVMARAEWVGESSTFSASFVPRLQTESPLIDSTVTAFDPRFGQTNAHSKALVTLETKWGDVSPQALYFYDEWGNHFGLNLSHVVGKSIVAYAEWAGSISPNLSERATEFAEATGTFPQNTAPLPQQSTNRAFQNDAAFGFSWTSESKFTVNLEYIYHQAGFNQNDFANWNKWGALSPILGSQLWYVRQYASDQQEPLAQQELFLRVDVPEVGFQKLGANALAFIHPQDGSALLQVSPEYNFSDHLTFAAYWISFLGSSTSQYGTIPIQNSISAKAIYYF